MKTLIKSCNFECRSGHCFFGVANSRLINTEGFFCDIRNFFEFKIAKQRRALNTTNRDAKMFSHIQSNGMNMNPKAEETIGNLAEQMEMATNEFFNQIDLII